MAYITQDTLFRGGLTDRFAHAVSILTMAVVKQVQYRRTVRVLSTLDDAMLDDLGFTRAGIPAAAHKAVYGA